MDNELFLIIAFVFCHFIIALVLSIVYSREYDDSTDYSSDVLSNE